MSRPPILEPFRTMFPKSNPSYEPVVQEDEEQDVTPSARSSAKPRPRILIILSLGVVLALVLLTTRILAFIGRVHPRPPLSCGTTPSSARENGCFFDLISFAWQVPECYDASLVSEFSSWDTWSFFIENRGNVTLPQEIAMLGEQSLYTTWYYHVVHCTFMWRQMHRAFERGWIDSHLLSYNHTLHCQAVLLAEGFAPDDVVTQANVIFPECLRVGNGHNHRVNGWDSIYSG